MSQQGHHVSQCSGKRPRATSSKQRKRRHSQPSTLRPSVNSQITRESEARIVHSRQVSSEQCWFDEVWCENNCIIEIAKPRSKVISPSSPEPNSSDSGSDRAESAGSKAVADYYEEEFTLRNAAYYENVTDDVKLSIASTSLSSDHNFNSQYSLSSPPNISEMLIPTNKLCKPTPVKGSSASLEGSGQQVSPGVSPRVYRMCRDPKYYPIRNNNPTRPTGHARRSSHSAARKSLHADLSQVVSPGQPQVAAGKQRRQPRLCELYVVQKKESSCSCANDQTEGRIHHAHKPPVPKFRKKANKRSSLSSSNRTSDSIATSSNTSIPSSLVSSTSTAPSSPISSPSSYHTGSYSDALDSDDSLPLNEELVLEFPSWYYKLVCSDDQSADLDSIKNKSGVIYRILDNGEVIRDDLQKDANSTLQDVHDETLQGPSEHQENLSADLDSQDDSPPVAASSNSLQVAKDNILSQLGATDDSDTTAAVSLYDLITSMNPPKNVSDIERRQHDDLLTQSEVNMEDDQTDSSHPDICDSSLDDELGGETEPDSVTQSEAEGADDSMRFRPVSGDMTYDSEEFTQEEDVSVHRTSAFHPVNTNSKSLLQPLMTATVSVAEVGHTSPSSTCSESDIVETSKPDITFSTAWLEASVGELVTSLWMSVNFTSSPEVLSAELQDCVYPIVSLETEVIEGVESIEEVITPELKPSVERPRRWTPRPDAAVPHHLTQSTETFITKEEISEDLNKAASIPAVNTDASAVDSVTQEKQNTHTVDQQVQVTHCDLVDSKDDLTDSSELDVIDEIETEKAVLSSDDDTSPPVFVRVDKAEPLQTRVGSEAIATSRSKELPTIVTESTAVSTGSEQTYSEAQKDQQTAQVETAGAESHTADLLLDRSEPQQLPEGGTEGLLLVAAKQLDHVPCRADQLEVNTASLSSSPATQSQGGQEQRASPETINHPQSDSSFASIQVPSRVTEFSMTEPDLSSAVLSSEQAKSRQLDSISEPSNDQLLTRNNSSQLLVNVQEEEMPQLELSPAAEVMPASATPAAIDEETVELSSGTAEQNHSLVDAQESPQPTLHDADSIQPETDIAAEEEVKTPLSRLDSMLDEEVTVISPEPAAEQQRGIRATTANDADSEAFDGDASSEGEDNSDNAAGGQWPMASSLNSALDDTLCDDSSLSHSVDELSTSDRSARESSVDTVRQKISSDSHRGSSPDHHAKTTPPKRRRRRRVKSDSPAPAHECETSLPTTTSPDKMHAANLPTHDLSPTNEDSDLASTDTDDLLAAGAVLSEGPNWDYYQENKEDISPLPSNATEQDPPYSTSTDPEFDVDLEPKLDDSVLQWDDELEDNTTLADIRVGEPRLPLPAGAASAASDSEDSDMEDLHYVIQQSSSQLLQADSALRKPRKDVIQCGIYLDPQKYVEWHATCQTNVKCLQVIQEHLESDQGLPNLTDDDIQQVLDLIKKWQSLEKVSLERKAQSATLCKLYRDLCASSRLLQVCDEQAAITAFNDVSELEGHFRSLQTFKLNLQSQSHKFQQMTDTLMVFEAENKKIKTAGFKQMISDIQAQLKPSLLNLGKRSSELQLALVQWHKWNTDCREIESCLAKTSYDIESVQLTQCEQRLVELEASLLEFSSFCSETAHNAIEEKLTALRVRQNQLMTDKLAAEPDSANLLEPEEDDVIHAGPEEDDVIQGGSQLSRAADREFKALDHVNLGFPHLTHLSKTSTDSGLFTAEPSLASASPREDTEVSKVEGSVSLEEIDETDLPSGTGQSHTHPDVSESVESGIATYDPLELLVDDILTEESGVDAHSSLLEQLKNRPNNLPTALSGTDTSIPESSTTPHVQTPTPVLSPTNEASAQTTSAYTADLWWGNWPESDTRMPRMEPLTVEVDHENETGQSDIQTPPTLEDLAPHLPITDKEKLKVAKRKKNKSKKKNKTNDESVYREPAEDVTPETPTSPVNSPYTETPEALAASDLEEQQLNAHVGQPLNELRELQGAKGQPESIDTSQADVSMLTLENIEDLPETESGAQGAHLSDFWPNPSSEQKKKKKNKRNKRKGKHSGDNSNQADPALTLSDTMSTATHQPESPTQGEIIPSNEEAIPVYGQETPGYRDDNTEGNSTEAEQPPHSEEHQPPSDASPGEGPFADYVPDTEQERSGDTKKQRKKRKKNKHKSLTDDSENQPAASELISTEIVAGDVDDAGEKTPSYEDYVGADKPLSAEDEPDASSTDKPDSHADLDAVDGSDISVQVGHEISNATKEQEETDEQRTQVLSDNVEMEQGYDTLVGTLVPFHEEDQTEATAGDPRASHTGLHLEDFWSDAVQADSRQKKKGKKKNRSMESPDAESTLDTSPSAVDLNQEDGAASQEVQTDPLERSSSEAYTETDTQPEAEVQTETTPTQDESVGADEPVPNSESSTNTRPPVDAQSQTYAARQSGVGVSTEPVTSVDTDSQTSSDLLSPKVAIHSTEKERRDKSLPPRDDGPANRPNSIAGLLDERPFADDDFSLSLYPAEIKNTAESSTWQADFRTPLVGEPENLLESEEQKDNKSSNDQPERGDEADLAAHDEGMISGSSPHTAHLSDFWPSASLVKTPRAAKHKRKGKKNKSKGGLVHLDADSNNATSTQLLLNKTYTDEQEVEVKTDSKPRESTDYADQVDTSSPSSLNDQGSSDKAVAVNKESHEVQTDPLKMSTSEAYTETDTQPEAEVQTETTPTQDESVGADEPVPSSESFTNTRPPVDAQSQTDAARQSGIGVSTEPVTGVDTDSQTAVEDDKLEHVDDISEVSKDKQNISLHTSERKTTTTEPDSDLAEDKAPAAELAEDKAPAAELAEDEAPAAELAEDEAPTAELAEDKALTAELAEDMAPTAELAESKAPAAEDKAKQRESLHQKRDKKNKHKGKQADQQVKSHVIETPDADVNMTAFDMNSELYTDSIGDGTSAADEVDLNGVAPLEDNLSPALDNSNLLQDEPAERESAEDVQKEIILTPADDESAPEPVVRRRREIQRQPAVETFDNEEEIEVTEVSAESDASSTNSSVVVNPAPVRSSWKRYALISTIALLMLLALIFLLEPKCCEVTRYYKGIWGLRKKYTELPPH